MRAISIWNYPCDLTLGPFEFNYDRPAFRLRISRDRSDEMRFGRLGLLPRDMRRAVLDPMCRDVRVIDGVEERYMNQKIVSVPEFSEFVAYVHAVGVSDGCGPGFMDGMRIRDAIICAGVILRVEIDVNELVAVCEEEHRVWMLERGRV